MESSPNMFESSISSIEEYTSLVFALTSESNQARPSIKKWAPVFRGQSNKQWELLPTIARGREFSCIRTILNEERNLIEDAKFRLPSVFKNDLNVAPVNLLALLQHYGIPTRLLDTTSSPLVALYFACQRTATDDDTDGEVIVFKRPLRSIANYPVINAIADSYRFASTNITFLSSFYETVLQQSYFLEQVSSLRALHETAAQGGQWMEECCKQPLFIRAQERLERQRLQHGQFILFPNRIVPEDHEFPAHFELIIDPILKTNTELVLKRIIVPRDSKSTLLHNLEILGISKATLFADNIDYISEQIVSDAKRRL